MKNKREHKSSTYSPWAKNIKMLIIEKGEGRVAPNSASQ